jgi:3-oxo-5-alpha-steroid 4-dehydrogenase 1
MDYFLIFLGIMIAIAIIVFVTLFFIDAGYGIFISSKWGYTIPNKLGWLLMEAPVVILLLLFWVFSDRKMMFTPLIFLLFLQIHYIHRAFIFPFLLKGRSKMPLGIMFMGFFFNIANAFMQGYWIFYYSPQEMYGIEWLQTPAFIIGTCLFFTGLVINMDSDKRIRNLRKNGDNKHYLPQGGMYNYVTSANYFGEFIEWTGFAIATWSIPGLVFAIWTFANLVPRANAIYKKYNQTFADEMQGKNLKRIFPFVY